MRFIPVDTSALRFLVSSEPVQAVDFTTKAPRVNKDGQPIFSVEFLVSGEGRRSEVITVKVAGAKPSLSEGQKAKVTGLVANPWLSEDKKLTVPLYATSVEPLSSSSTSSKAA